MLSYNILTKNGGSVSDLKTHWEYIILLKEDIKNLYTLTLGVDINLLNTPLHHLIFSQITFINSLNIYLITVFIISLFLPIIFYFTLKERFNDVNKSILILLSSLIYIFPVFQYSAIWGNNHISALIFFTFGVFFYNSFIRKNYKNISFLFISIFFFALACYVKQFYVFFFIYLIILLFKKIDKKKFFNILLFIFICAVPGFYFLFINPLLFFGITQDYITNFNSAILVSASIIFFYLIPFIIQNFLNFSGKFQIRLSNIFNKKIFITSFLIVIICSINFQYNLDVGGGFFLKASKIILDSKVLIFPTSFLGIYFLLYYCQNKLIDYLLVTLLLITFSTGFYIFQKFFEPMFYIIFLNFFDKKKILMSIRKSNYIIILFFITYYISLNYIYFLGL